MVSQDMLWILLKEVIYKELDNVTADATSLEKLDYIILTMLIDYRTKKSKLTPDNRNTQEVTEENINILYDELDQALQYNRNQLEEIKRLFIE
ncbi:hypothetical protein [Ornithinibacillus halotolerans]|uniref:Uncharacterized protein n=1 Tax=Ornithinibacillus halotolerans TaxID=1274357 RepID=A0A916S0G6_9BACI|nr:hypothetical protein [Ornithinibacillus halotolerans]GGA75926.1 hypothetical protein GCM10008025_19470 [Ornithinibacillus halotolerans]